MRIRIPLPFRRARSSSGEDRGSDSAWRVLGILGATALAVFLLSDALLVRSDAFWSFVRPRCGTGASIPLRIEARLHDREPGSVEVLLVGSSLVESDVDAWRLEDKLGLPHGTVMKVSLPCSRSAEHAMLTDTIAELQPRTVVLLASVWNGYAPMDWGQLRYYDPALARHLVGWRGLLAEHHDHATQWLASHNVVVRHRAQLRRALLAGPDWETEEVFWDRVLEGPVQVFGPPLGERMADQVQSLDEFHWPNPQTEAVGWMAERLAANGIEFVLAAAPTRDTYGADEQLREALAGYLEADARERGYRYLDGPASRVTAGHEYFDEYHLNPSGRQMYTDWLAGALAAPPPADGGR